MVISLNASTDRHSQWGGPGRYIRILVHENLNELRAAAVKYSPIKDGWGDAIGGFHPSPIREIFDEDRGRWVKKKSNFAGIIRLCKGHLTAEVITHECVHAAAHIYRMDVTPSVHLGTDNGKREENLAYIAGDLAGSVALALTEAQLW